MPEAVRLGLISDTHGKLRPEVFPPFEGVAAILHAGDIGSIDILTQLEAIAPVHAVWGNTDDHGVRTRVPEVARLGFVGRRIVIAHGHQLGSPTAEGLVERFPDAEVIVYGHTHRPAIDRCRERWVVNPGSAGPQRFGNTPSVAILTISADHEDIALIQL